MAPKSKTSATKRRARGSSSAEVEIEHLSVIHLAMTVEPSVFEDGKRSYLLTPYIADLSQSKNQIRAIFDFRVRRSLGDTPDIVFTAKYFCVFRVKKLNNHEPKELTEHIGRLTVWPVFVKLFETVINCSAFDVMPPPWSIEKFYWEDPDRDQKDEARGKGGPEGEGVNDRPAPK